MVGSVTSARPKGVSNSTSRSVFGVNRTSPAWRPKVHKSRESTWVLQIDKAGSSAGNTTVPFMETQSISSPFPRTIFAKEPKVSRWASRAFRTQPMWGRVQLPKVWMSPTALAPNSSTATSMDAFNRIRVSGTPSWLLKLPRVINTEFGSWACACMIAPRKPRVLVLP